MTFESLAEQRAEAAQKYTCFGGLNLRHIREQVKTMLSLIGGHGIFDQYTKHDISHIDTMLQLSTLFIIPGATQAILTPADWLMQVLSIYFHDIGMLVTRSEFEKRNQSTFPTFKTRIVSGDQGANYEQRLSILDDEAKERFLYQEFVRGSHASRIRAWVSGKAGKEFGIADDTVHAISHILDPLPTDFRSDLGLVCESHHSNDLDNINKYQISKPYGLEPQTYVNLQYAAIILRTADLLHITSDRTPSIMFKTISPTDPLSQREWAKQGAVKSIRAQLGKDKDGRLSQSAPQKVVEVFADFDNIEGFFGLSSYLDYAARELKQSNKWAVQSQTDHGSAFAFPWEDIDRSKIETRGFEKEKLGFEIDTYRILELLTGHTLYNNTGVVVRELVQNCLDAIRVAFWSADGRLAQIHGKIDIHWDNVDRTLTIRDNGTGMSEEIIKNHLLKVGSSRYRSEEFIRDNPDFVAISRFGIGVLSAFMVADDVTYTTYSKGDKQARRILMKTLHGTYLTQLIDKDDEQVNELLPHGTEVKIRLRATARVLDIASLVRYWIVIPRCHVFLRINGGSATKIGFANAKEALEDAIAASSMPRDNEYKIIEKTKDGIDLAFGVVWSRWFKTWNFLAHSARADGRMIPLGTCIEGVRVEQTSPGFNGFPLLAILNVSGKTAPLTNVARSGIETDSETDNDPHLFRLYQLYLEHVADERRSMQDERNFSLTWAANEANHIVNGLFGFKGDAQRGVKNDAMLDKALLDTELVLVEVNDERRLESVRKLREFSSFWTVESESYRSIERLLKEVPDSSSISTILSAVGGNKLKLPNGPVVVSNDTSTRAKNLIFTDREVKKIVVDSSQRRLDLEWQKIGEEPLWIVPQRDWPRMGQQIANIMRRLEAERHVRVDREFVIAKGQIDVQADSSWMIVEGADGFFLLPSPVQQFFVSVDQQIRDGANADPFWFMTRIVQALIHSRLHISSEVMDFFQSRYMPIIRETEFATTFPTDQLLKVMEASSWDYFNARLFSREMRDSPF